MLLLSESRVLDILRRVIRRHKVINLRIYMKEKLQHLVPSLHFKHQVLITTVNNETDSIELILFVIYELSQAARNIFHPCI